MWKLIVSNARTLFIVVLVVVAGLLVWGRQQFTGPGPLAEAICFHVQKGDSFSAVSQSLEGQGVVSDAWIFRIGAEYSGQANRLKFGSYLLRANASMEEVLRDLTVGGKSTCGREVNYRISVTSAEVVLRELDATTNRYVELVKFDPVVKVVPSTYVDVAKAGDIRWRVTLAEGVTSWQVVDALKRADFLTGEIAKVPPEGSLSPGSYEVERGDERLVLLAEMAARQVATMADLWATRAEGLPYDTPEEAMIMASIVENETGLAEERKRVASVFINRIKLGMRLQTDPTVIYGITKGEAVLGRGLRQSELQRKTPYNTYIIDGLPPTPIANPGRLSIEAVLNPEKTDYLYFVADGSGGHAFARTLAEHNSNVAKWREIEARQGTPKISGVQD